MVKCTRSYLNAPSYGRHHHVCKGDYVETQKLKIHPGLQGCDEQTLEWGSERREATHTLRLSVKPQTLTHSTYTLRVEVAPSQDG